MNTAIIITILVILSPLIIVFGFMVGAFIFGAIGIFLGLIVLGIWESLKVIKKFLGLQD